MDEDLKVKYIDALHRKLINDKAAVETQYRTEKETKDKELAAKLAASQAELTAAEKTAAFDAARAINDYELLAAGNNQKAIFEAKTNRLNLERSAELIQLQDLYNQKVADLAKRKADDIRTAEESGQETTSNQEPVPGTGALHYPGIQRQKTRPGYPVPTGSNCFAPAAI